MDIQDWLNSPDSEPEELDKLIRTSKSGWDAFQDMICSTISNIMIERRRLSVMDFAEGKYEGIVNDNGDHVEPGMFIPASGGQPKPGLYSSENGPVMYEVGNAFSDHEVDEITMMIGAQVGKSRTMQCMIGWAIAISPGPITIIYPNDDMADVKMEEDFLPSVWATPELNPLVSPDEKKGQRDKGRKGRFTFPGGWVRFVSGRSTPAVKGSPAQYLFIEEHAETVSKAPLDPDGLAMPRTTQFANYKIVRLSTPMGSRETCATTRKYNESDKSKPFVTCPKCKHEHIMKFENVSFGVNSLGKKCADGSTYECPNCKYKMIDAVRDSMIDGVSWKQTAMHSHCGINQDPMITRNWDENGIHKCTECGKRASKKHRGFWASVLYAKNVSISSIVQRFLNAKDNAKDLQEFINQSLAENFEPAGSFHSDIVKDLNDRIEDYQELYGNNVQVPPGVKFVLMTVDVQPDRLEYIKMGWGNFGECWMIEPGIVYGSPSNESTWMVLDQMRCRPMIGVDNRVYHVSMCGIDIGDGNTAAEAMKYITPNKDKGVFALRGEKDSDLYKMFHPNFSKHKYPHDVIGTTAARFALDKKLRIWYKGNDNALTCPSLPEAIHFGFYMFDLENTPVQGFHLSGDSGEVLATIGIGDDFMDQLTNFEQVPVRNRKTGQRDLAFKERSKKVREEILDNFCYQIGTVERMKASFNVGYIEQIPDQWKLMSSNYIAASGDFNKFNKAPNSNENQGKVRRWKFAPNKEDQVSDKVVKNFPSEKNPFSV